MFLHLYCYDYLPGGLFSTQMLSLLMNPSAQSQWKEPSSLIQASLSPGHAIARSLHSSISVRRSKEKQFKDIRKKVKRWMVYKFWSWVVYAYPDTWLLSICSHVHISYNGQDHYPCIPRMPGHSLDTTRGQHHILNWVIKCCIYNCKNFSFNEKCFFFF